MIYDLLSTYEASVNLVQPKTLAENISSLAMLNKDAKPT